MNLEVIISAVLGGIGFLIIFLIGKSFLVALIFGILLLICSYYVIKPKRKTLKEIEESSLRDQSNSFENSKVLIEKLSDLQKKIKNKEMNNSIEVSLILSEIIETGKSILSIASDDKKNLDVAENFIDYYLPSVVAIVDKYTQININSVNSKETMEFQNKVLDFLKDIKIAFEKQKVEMFKDDILDASVDMDVLKNILKSNGLLDNDL